MRIFCVVTNIFPGPRWWPCMYIDVDSTASDSTAVSVMVLCFTPLQAQGNVSSWLQLVKVCTVVSTASKDASARSKRSSSTHWPQGASTPRPWVGPTNVRRSVPKLVLLLFFFPPFVVKKANKYKNNIFIWSHCHFIATLLKFKPTEG